MEATDPEAEEGYEVVLTTEEVYGDLVCMLNDFTSLYPQFSALVSFMQKSSKGVITYLRYHDGSLSEHTCEAFEGTRYLIWCSLVGIM